MPGGETAIGDATRTRVLAGAPDEVRLEASGTMNRTGRNSAPMDTITYSNARANLAKTMERVCDDRAPVVITRRNAKPVVMMSLDDYHQFDETAYLLRSPENARRIREAVAELAAGGGTERNLVE